MWIRCWTTPLSVNRRPQFVPSVPHRSPQQIRRVDGLCCGLTGRNSSVSQNLLPSDALTCSCRPTADWLWPLWIRSLADDNVFYRSSPPGGHFGIHTFPPLYSVVLLSFIVFLVVLLLPVFRAEVKHRVVQSLLLLWNDKCRIEMKMAEK